MKHRAEDIAADASGVTEVRNEIRVDNGGASFGRPGEAVR
jgi:osmotically-inducible protein OsmY